MDIKHAFLDVERSRDMVTVSEMRHTLYQILIVSQFSRELF